MNCWALAPLRKSKTNVVSEIPMLKLGSKTTIVSRNPPTPFGSIFECNLAAGLRSCRGFRANRGAAADLHGAASHRDVTDHGAAAAEDAAVNDDVRRMEPPPFRSVVVPPVGWVNMPPRRRHAASPR